MKNRNILYVAVVVLGVGLWYVYNEKVNNNGLSGIFSEKTPAHEDWLNDPGWSNNQQPESMPPATNTSPPPDTNPPMPPNIRPPRG